MGAIVSLTTKKREGGNIIGTLDWQPGGRMAFLGSIEGKRDNGVGPASWVVAGVKHLKKGEESK